MATADVQRQVVAVRPGETAPMNSPVGESQSNGRVENAVQRVQGLIRTLKGALERRLNTKTRSSDPTFSVDDRHDARAPVAEFGEEIMYMTSKNTSKSVPK